jgi:hypothetical protein
MSGSICVSLVLEVPKKKLSSIPKTLDLVVGSHPIRDCPQGDVGINFFGKMPLVIVQQARAF